MGHLLLVWTLILSAPDVATGQYSVTIYRSQTACEQAADKIAKAWADAGTTRVYAYCEPGLLR